MRRELHRYHGRELDTAGDGFFASFERPAQAIECATGIVDRLRPLDLHIRAAIHMGEVEIMGGKVGGITVHVASRALAKAGPDEVVVTSTVRQVVAGADVTFSDGGVHEFKGVPEDWHLYAVEWRRRELPAVWPVAPGAEEAGRRRPGWRAAGGAALLGAGLTAVAAFLLLVGGTAAPPLVPQPNSAIRVDPATNTIAAVVPAGGSPTGIGIADDTVWVLSLGDRLLTAVPLAGGSPRAIGLPGTPTGLAVGGGSAWVAFGYGTTGESAGVVLRVSAANPQQQQKIPIGNGANAIALDESGVWVTNGVANTLTKIDPATRSIASTVEVGGQPVAVALGDGSVWVAHALSKTIWRIDPLTLEKTAEISLPDPPTALAVGFGRVWMTSNVGNTVIVINPATDRLVATVSLDQGPRGIAAGNDALWVAGSRGALLRIDPESRKVSRSIDLPGPAEGVAVSGENVWVTVQQ